MPLPKNGPDLVVPPHAVLLSKHMQVPWHVVQIFHINEGIIGLLGP